MVYGDELDCPDIADDESSSLDNENMNANLVKELLHVVVPVMRACQGAQQNGCDGACDTTAVTLSGSVRPILEPHCTGCHSGAAPQGGISLVNYSDIKARADDGSLLGSIRHDVAWSPMPKNQDQLPACKIATIRIWIEDGAPDN